MARLDNPVASGVGYLCDIDGNAAFRQGYEFWPNAEFEPFVLGHAISGVSSLDRFSGEVRLAAAEVGRQHIHARRADEIADESVLRALEEIDRRADLHNLALMHDHDLVGKGQCLGLIVSYVDHGGANPLM